MLRLGRNSVNGRLNRNTFCSGAEVVPVQCKRALVSNSNIDVSALLEGLNIFDPRS